MKNLPSIFNDVIGPVMRGPSSSHTAASWRIARTGLDILTEPLEKAVIQFDRDGAWAPNYREQGTVMGINGGLLGLEITDSRMKATEQLAREMAIDIQFEVSSFPTDHANTVRLFLTGKNGKTVKVLAGSTGGGAFEIREVDDFKVALHGNFHSLLIRTAEPESLAGVLAGFLPDRVLQSTNHDSVNSLLQLNNPEPIEPGLIDHLNGHPAADELVLINPLLPVVSGKGSEPPFTSFRSCLEYPKTDHVDAGQLGLLYEKHMSGLTDRELRSKMEEIIGIVHHSMATGLAGTQYEDRILQQQSHRIQQAADQEIGRAHV